MHARPTKHQLRVAGFVARGLLDKEIAFVLGVEPVTVKQHMFVLRKKLRIAGKSRVRIALWYLSVCSPIERAQIIADWPN